MRGLYGDLGTMPLKDLVVYFGNRRASGVLNIEREDVKKTVTLSSGLVINAGSNRPSEYLGQFLINMGQLTEDQFSNAYEEQRRTAVLLGRILVNQGLVGEGAVGNALLLKFRETLLSSMSWSSGTFSFTPTDDPATVDGVDTSVDLLDVVKEAEFREIAWQAIHAVFPHGRLRLSLQRENLAEKPKLGSLDERLFVLMEEGATIDDMVLALHATDFFLYQRLYALYRLEAISVEEAPMPTLVGGQAVPLPGLVGDEPPINDIMNHALAFFEDGNLEGALVLAQRAVELRPDAETEAFVKRTEGALLTSLRKELMDGDPVASLAFAPAKLKTMTLTAPERYLLSRTDGARSVRNIVQVAPLRELQALRAYRDFIEKGWVILQSTALVDDASLFVIDEA